MSVLVVGTVGIDTVETPKDRKENILGGSAVYFSYAASYYTQVHLVGVVGTDFPDEHRSLLHDRGIDLAGLESHVDTVCAAITELPPASCTGLKPVLIKLIDGLNGLARKIAEQHETIAGKLQGLSSHRKAVTAYAADPAKPGRSRSD